VTNASDVLRSAETVLLDFDGPVCSVFAGITDIEVADRLREVLRREGASMPSCVAETNDPIAVLEFTTGHKDLVLLVEDALIAAELQAIRQAGPTPYAVEFMAAVRESGKRLAIVSNNSSEAVRAYLEEAGASEYVEVVAGRSYGRPDLMKPNVFPVQQALKELGTTTATAVLIGDSLSDVEVSNEAGVASIGFANKPGKAELLRSAGATAVLDAQDGLRTLVDALREPVL
jgi:HAD superfamily hydrolase (TIGR01549 family)